MRLKYLILIIICLLFTGCRSSEYYHRTNTPDQRDAHYRMCREQADAARAINEMDHETYKAYIVRCMEDMGYVYQD